MKLEYIVGANTLLSKTFIFLNDFNTSSVNKSFFWLIDIVKCLLTSNRV